MVRLKPGTETNGILKYLAVREKLGKEV